MSSMREVTLLKKHVDDWNTEAVKQLDYALYMHYTSGNITNDLLMLKYLGVIC